MFPRSYVAAVLSAVTATVLGCDGRSTAPSGPPGPASLDPLTPGAAACLDPDGNPLPVAPESQRVDRETPTFSDPTRITNPLFPIGSLFRAVFYGKVDGAPLRLETTLLPETKTVTVDGRDVETLVSQFVAWVDGRLNEVAIDRYAQADDGAVWYFGEDVFDFEGGEVVSTEGTWLAGKDGPAAMIMPAHPRVGDVWRPENICGVVFEEVTAKATDTTVQSAHGPVGGSLIVQELHQDATLEAKVFAPGFGEWTSGSGDNLEAVALALPADALPGLPPRELETLASGAAEIFDAAQAEDWESASGSAGDMVEAWATYRAGGVPALVEERLQGALDSLTAAIAAQDMEQTRRMSLLATFSILDLELRYRTAAATDLDLLDVWARQLVVDAEAGDQPGVISDATSLRWIRDRVARDLSPSALMALDAKLDGVGGAVAARDLGAARAAVGSFRATVASTRAVPR